MDPQFRDRTLLCADCNSAFVFTAGEQFFFLEKQFKNDPKRCKPCKSRRSGLAAVANGASPAAAGISRTETRTLCSDCNVETTVPFKPTQGRPVLCRACFQMKARTATQNTLAAQPAFSEVQTAQTISALTDVSVNRYGAILSPDAAVLAVASMAFAPSNSSVATVADLASITDFDPEATNLVLDQSMGTPRFTTLEQLAREAAEA